jgi:cation-transporting ATPase F
LVRRIVPVSIVLLTAAFLRFQGLLDMGSPVAEARTVGINVFVFVQIAYLISCRSLDRPWLGGWNRCCWRNRADDRAVGTDHLRAGAQHLLHTAPRGVWLLILSVSVLAFQVVEADKLIWR